MGESETSVRHRARLEPSIGAQETEKLIQSYIWLLAAIKQAPFGIQIISKEENSLRVLVDNAQSVRIIGIPMEGVGPDNYVGMPCRFIRPSDLTEISVTDMPPMRALRGETVKDEEILCVRLDGQSTIVLSSATPIWGPNGEINAVVATYYDISERRRAEEALRRSEAQLRLLSQRIMEVQEEERTRISRDLHDQLGQEIVALKMEAVALKDLLKGSHSLHERAMSLVALVDQLNANVHRVAVSIRPAVLDELGLVRAIQSYAEAFEERTGISTHVDVPTAYINLDIAIGTAAYRILQETLTNVWKHSCASRVDIKLEAEGDLLVLRISDDGVGMDMRHLSAKTSLGFASMRERAHSVGGDLRVSSRPGKGLTIVALLPAKHETDYKRSDDSINEPRIRVLLADDHGIVRAGLKRILEETPDIRVVAEAADGLEAIRAYRQHNPDVAILDISMPLMDGLEVVNYIRAIDRKARILIVTVHPEEGYAARLLKAGALGYITKGTSPDTLREAVRTVAQSKRFLADKTRDIVSEQLLNAPSKVPLAECLSNRELQVFCLIAQGCKPREIAEELGISVRTIQTFKTRAMRKLSLRTDADITRFVLDNHLIESTVVPAKPPTPS
jgi:PAS domain S-box-containing protein